MRLRRILENRQLEWAQARGIETRRDEQTGVPLLQLVNLNDNFRVPLPDEARTQLMRGSGGELNPPDCATGHVYSLGSSMALCLNFMEAWRGGGIEVFAQALGFDEDRPLRAWYDVRVPLSVKRTEAPSVDTMLVSTKGDGFMYGIEAKFCEAFDGKPRPPLTRAYSDRKDLLDGWPRMLRLARMLDGRSEEAPRRIHASQLIRQLMVMRKNFGRSNFALIHLWYDVNDRDARAYQAELDDFALRARQDGIAFLARSWHRAFKLTAGLETPDGWRDYMDSRYGLSKVAKAE
ncbi:MAG TPA: hypothetical protein PLZ95_20050 [Bryobacteraceae bacterium]|nr:hypothetical protein [Bryobacteraceae bacterium]